MNPTRGLGVRGVLGLGRYRRSPRGRGWCTRVATAAFLGGPASCGEVRGAAARRRRGVAPATVRSKDDVSLERHRRVFSSGMWCCRRRTTRRGSVAPGIRPTMPRAGVPCGVPDVFLSRCKVYVTLKTPVVWVRRGFLLSGPTCRRTTLSPRIAAKNDAVTHLCHFANHVSHCRARCQQSAS